MIAGLLKKIFGSRNDRLIRQYSQKVRAINALEPKIQGLSDAELRGKTDEFRRRVAEGEILDALLPVACAVVREAGKRVHGMRHFDMQLVGGMVLHDGKIAEMRTGEGKTLTATLPVYLNALSGKGVHVITVNDYLASRDSDWMGRIYRFLGLSVGCNLSQMPHDQKKAAYAADITYGTNNEFGFDYLRDNMVYELGERVQRGLNYAIVDEVDSILIDEARTPLIISGQAEDHTELYLRMNAVPPMLTRQEGEGDNITQPGAYTVDLKAHSVLLTEQGHEHAEEILARLGLLAEGASLYDPGNILLIHHLYAALRAHALYHKDQHYVVQNGEVVIVDEFTGRLMAGRRWSEGLHQAVEAKEGVKIQAENQTLASITFQNYFRMYGKLSGMTGTADTEAYEFHQIYGLETVVVPTSRPMIRKDQNDKVYRTMKEKHDAIVADIKDCVSRGQPVLVGTTSIENSELLSDLLNRAKLPHNVLNAKQHAREAEIVAEAGRPGIITIATNMAGRGTDIVLGGNVEKAVEALEADESLDDATRQARVADLRANWQKDHDQIKALGGLRIIATERHESRRIDNQLRGRSGRQGDPGRSSFYLSLEDDLMRIFGSDKLDKVLSTLGMKEGEAIIHPWVNKSLERAQAKVEGRNFDMRKQLLKFDDVMNDQRKVIFSQRLEIMESEDLEEIVRDMRHQVIDDLAEKFLPPRSYAEQWNTEGLYAAMLEKLALDVPVIAWANEEGVDQDAIRERLYEASDAQMAQKAEAFGADTMRQIEKQFLLQTIDAKWREHLVTLEHLRSVIGFRGYAQRDPLAEYKTEAFQLFEHLLDSLREDVTQKLAQVRPMTAEEQEVLFRQMQERQAALNAPVASAAAVAAPKQPVLAGFDEGDPATWGNPGRNDPCPCGSGEKFKHCHGRLA